MIQIKCTGSDLLPLDAIEEFQGGLKKRTKEDIAKIIKSIELYGFSFPFFVWNGSGHNYCLDGHGRIQALAKMRQAGEDLPMFPVVYVDAENEEEAKNKLLRLNSQYGQMTVDSVMEFAGDIHVEWGELSLSNEGILNIAEYNSKDDSKELSENYKSEYEIVVEVTSEIKQKELYEELIKRGFNCRLSTL